MIARSAHGAPLERKMIHDLGYKHYAPPELHASLSTALTTFLRKPV